MAVICVTHINNVILQIVSNNDSSDRKFTFDRKTTLITPYLNSQWLNPNLRGLRDDTYYGLIIGSSEIWSDKGAA